MQQQQQVSPLDFPQVYQHPPYEALIACLTKLHLEPPIWNPSTSRRVILKDHENSAQFRREVAAYLAGIIKSDLDWIGDDDQKEDIWNEASKRLSERCGRAGMGEITRRWPFASETHPPFELIIREPPITGDALGLKTWGSSYYLAQQLEHIAAKSLSHILSPSDAAGPLRVLELGSGTGLLGLAAAAIWRTRVIVTDLPKIMPNLGFNADQNHLVIESLGGSVETGALTWGGSDDDDEMFDKKHQFKIVLAADPLYDDEHPTLLASAIQDHLMESSESRLVAMVPLRDSTTRTLLSKLRSVLEQGDSPLTCLEEHTLFGQDDWDDEDDDPAQVECWWGVFGRSNRS